jgi:hypothetical protein
VAAGTQEPVSLAIADRGIDPMPGSRRVDEVECFLLTVPLLERHDVDLDGETDQVAARALRELRTHLNADDGEAALEQDAGCLASRATNLQEPVTALEVGHLDEVIEKLSRI